MNLKRLVPISLIALSLSVFVPINQVANAEELWALYYNGINYATHVCTVDVCGSGGAFTTNPATMAEVSRNAGCPAVCTYVHLDYNTRQPDGKTSTERITSTPTPTPTATPTPLDTSTATRTPTTPTTTTTPTTSINCQITANSSNSGCREVTGIQTSLINIGTNYFDFGICVNATSSYIWYTNVSYTWSVAGPSGVVSSGTSPSGLLASGTCGSQSNVQTVRVENLKQGTSYAINSSVTNDGKNYGSSMTVSTQASLTATTQTDTKTATTQTDTKTATTQTSTKTTTTTTTTTQSETRTAAVAVVAAISNVESRTVTASNLLNTYTATEKESLLNVTLNSAKSAVVNVSTDIPNIKMIVTATKAGSKPIVFNIKTDTEGDAQVKTSKNLTGYTVTLSANGVKLDSDKAIKK